MCVFVFVCVCLFADALYFQFQYVCCNIPGPNMPTELFEETINGCLCSGNSCGTLPDQTCSCQLYGANVCEYGLLRETALSLDSLSVVQECNSSCSCSKNCRNRVVQNGIKVRMEVFRDSVKGLCLRALETIERGKFVCEYAGDVLPETEARRRLRNLKDGDMNYLFILREHFQSGVLCTYIDPRNRGNIGRFISHSCCPNLVIVPVRVLNMVPRVCLFASRDIAAGEEVTYDYGQHGDQHGTSQESNVICSCGADNCRGYLPFDSAGM